MTDRERAAELADRIEKATADRWENEGTVPCFLFKSGWDEIVAALRAYARPVVTDEMVEAAIASAKSRGVDIADDARSILEAALAVQAAHRAKLAASVRSANDASRAQWPTEAEWFARRDGDFV